MTVIEAGSNRIIFRDEGEQMQILIECERARDTLSLGVFVKREEVLDAVGGVDKARMEEPCEGATEGFRRAEEAEAKLGEALASVDNWRQEVGIVSRKLAEAEATIERVRALARADSSATWADLRAALDPKPAFELPTAVPARIEAKRNGKTYTFYLWTNGAGGSNDLIWVDEDDWTHSPTPARLMEKFTDHRLLEGGVIVEDDEGETYVRYEDECSSPIVPVRGIARIEEDPEKGFDDAVVVMVDGDRVEEMPCSARWITDADVEKMLAERFWTVRGRYEDGWIVERRP